jgi:hypothetical protein
LTTTTNKAVSLLDMATSAKGQGAAVVSGTVSGKQSVAYINITKVLHHAVIYPSLFGN